MTQHIPQQFTFDHVLAADGSATFGCATDAALWPWMALDPFDPIVVQTLNFYAIYELAVARGHYENGQWTALTQTLWSCGELGVGHAVRGEAKAPRAEDGGYDIRFFDAQDALVYHMTGAGVVFRDRDFESWRREQKRELDTRYSSSEFPYAPVQALGVAGAVERYLEPLSSGRRSSARGLVTIENGFLPEHPYHSGSGDHVNATHLADVGRQFLRLLLDDPQLAVTGGEMRFRRYVELGHPFEVEVLEPSSSPGSTALAVRQAGSDCAAMTLQHRAL